MSSIASTLFNRTIPVFGYQVNMGQALTTALAVGALAVCAIKKMYASPQKSSPLPLVPTPLSNEEFWQKVRDVPTMAQENEPLQLGQISFSSPAAVRKEMYKKCNKTADYVLELSREDLQGKLGLDLGCGYGANAIPLAVQGCQMTLIDQEQDAIHAYKQHEKVCLPTSLYLEPNKTLYWADCFVNDITKVRYPKNRDFVICVDVLPYIQPSQLQKTMAKIFKALRPGGQFIGTIFFKPGGSHTSLTSVMEKLGAHFYPDQAFAREIVTRSGFQIKKQIARKDADYPPCCLEFWAEKPIEDSLDRKDSLDIDEKD